MNGRTKAYLAVLGLCLVLATYWAASRWLTAAAPPAPPTEPCDPDEGAVRAVLQDLLLSEDTQLLLGSIIPTPPPEELAQQLGHYLLHSGQLQELVREVMQSPQFTDTIVALVQQPEVQSVIKASIDLNDIQYLMEEMLSTPQGQAFIMELLTSLFSPPGSD